jgi:hypothetical protein
MVVVLEGKVSSLLFNGEMQKQDLENDHLPLLNLVLVPTATKSCFITV